MSDDPENGADERLASIERGLEHLKAGVGLLGITPCSLCNTYYRRSDPGALFHCGEFVCYDCVSNGGCAAVRNSVSMIGKKRSASCVAGWSIIITRK